MIADGEISIKKDSVLVSSEVEAGRVSRDFRGWVFLVMGAYCRESSLGN